MSIKLLWHNQQQLSIRMSFEKTATVNDWYMGISQLCVMLNEINHPVNVILDMSELDHLSYDIIASINACKPRIHDNHSSQVAIVRPHLQRPMNALLRNNSIITGTWVVTSIEEADEAFAQLMPYARIG